MIRGIRTEVLRPVVLNVVRVVLDNGREHYNGSATASVTASMTAK